MTFGDSEGYSNGCGARGRVRSGEWSLLLVSVTSIDYVYLPMFLFFALLDLSPALPYSAREKRQGTS